MEKQINKVASKATSNDLMPMVQYTQAALIQTIYFQADAIRFYRRMLMVLAPVFIALIIGLVFASQTPPPEVKYFSRDENGNFVELTPLSEMDVNLNELRIWAEGCIVESLELSFVNPLRRINKVLNRCFSSEGKNAYQVWLQKGVKTQMVRIGKAGAIRIDSELGRVISNKITLSVSPVAPGRLTDIQPIINEHGQQVKRWQLSIPLLVRKEEGTDGAGTTSVHARVILSRTNNDQFPKGAGIDTFIITSMK